MLVLWMRTATRAAPCCGHLGLEGNCNPLYQMNLTVDIIDNFITKKRGRFFAIHLIFTKFAANMKEASSKHCTTPTRRDATSPSDEHEMTFI